MPSKHMMKNIFPLPARLAWPPLALAAAVLCPSLKAQTFRAEVIEAHPLQAHLDAQPFAPQPANAQLLLVQPAAAESSSSQPLPDSPGTLLADSSSLDLAAGQTSTLAKDKQGSPSRNAPPKRLFGIVPNFRTVSTDTKLPPQTIKEKFVDASEDSFDYSSLALATVVALEGYVTTATPEFGRGGVGFSRYLWHSATDQTIENYVVEFIIPAVRHEDTRFYTLTRGSVTKRLEYSLGRVFITRSDSGHNTFNSGEVVGAAASAGISNLYYPQGERTGRNFIDKYATNLGIDAASYVLKEFYPEIQNAFSRRKSAPTP